MTKLTNDLTRIRAQTNENDSVYFRGHNIAVLMLRSPESLSDEERDLLIACDAQNACEDLFAVAHGKKIIPFAAHVFTTLGCETAFWGPHYDFYRERNLKIKALLDSVFLSFQRYNCKSVVLTENFAALLMSDSDLAGFCSGDVDLSADIAERDAINKCLESLGFVSKKQSLNVGEYTGQSMQFFSSSALEGGFWINVVWLPVTRAFLKQDKYAARLKNDRLVAPRLDNSNIKVLPATSLLYFCALHSAAGHYYTLSPGLRLFVDIDRLVRNCPIHWDDLMRWELEDEAGIRVSMALYLAHKVFQTPIPTELIDRIEQTRSSRILYQYLFDEQSCEIQSKSSKLRRLYVEVASDDRNFALNLICKAASIARSVITMRFT